MGFDFVIFIFVFVCIVFGSVACVFHLSTTLSSNFDCMCTLAQIQEHLMNICSGYKNQNHPIQFISFCFPVNLR